MMLASLFFQVPPRKFQYFKTCYSLCHLYTFPSIFFFYRSVTSYSLLRDVCSLHSIVAYWMYECVHSETNNVFTWATTAYVIIHVFPCLPYTVTHWYYFKLNNPCSQLLHGHWITCEATYITTLHKLSVLHATKNSVGKSVLHVKSVFLERMCLDIYLLQVKICCKATRSEQLLFLYLYSCFK